MARKTGKPFADPAENSKRKRVRGKPFLKGTSGNPGGRPKSVSEARDYCLQKAMLLIDSAVQRAECDRRVTLTEITGAIREMFDRAGVRGARDNNQREGKRIESVVAALGLPTITDENRNTLIDQLSKAPAEE